MRASALVLALALTGCAQAATRQEPVDAAPRIVVDIADVTDCGGSGTTCPELTSRRRLRVALDGTAEPFAGTPLRVAPGPGPRTWGIELRPGRVRVRWPRQAIAPFDVALRGFGSKPTLTWSPTGARFALLEEFRANPTNRVLVVDPGRRRSWILPLRPGVREIWALAFTSDDRLVAQILDRHGYAKLAELDAVTGRVLRSTFLEQAIARISWSSAARRLVIEDPEQRVGVITRGHPNDIRWAEPEGTPEWSPDGLRIVVDGENGRVGMVAWPSLAPIALPDELSSPTWLDTGHALLALRGGVSALTDAPAELVQIGDTGQVDRVLGVQWPARVDPDNDFSLAPKAIPTRIEGLDRFGP